jgi:hypothetical protein
MVKVDKNDFVISVERELSDAMVNSVMREVERADMPKLETRICRGPWHYKNGKGTPLPIDQFPFNRYRKNERTKTCGECLEKSGKRNSIPLGVKAEPLKVSKIVETKVPLTTKDIDAGMGSGVHKWKVLVLQPTEVIVYAHTYSEIPSEVQGEVLRVERLD